MTTAVLYENFPVENVTCTVPMTPRQKCAVDYLLTDIKNLDAKPRVDITFKANGIVFVTICLVLFGARVYGNWMFDERGNQYRIFDNGAQS